MLPTQGTQPFPSISSYVQRGVSPLTVWNLAGVSNQTTLTSSAVIANQIYAVPFVVGDGAVLDTLAFEVQTLAGGSNGRAAIYSNTNDDTIYPNTLVVETGSISCGSTGVKSLTGIGKAINPGIWWAAFVCDGTPSLRVINVSGQSHLVGLSAALALQGQLSVAFAYTAFPSTFPAGAAYAAGGSSYPAVAYYFSL